MLKAIRTNDVEAIRAMQIGPGVEIPIEKSKSLEMALVLKEKGADPFRYIGKGRVALDEMSKSFGILRFLRPDEPTPAIVQGLIRSGQEWMARGDKEYVHRLPHGQLWTEDLFRHMIVNGFQPVTSENHPSLEKLAEDILFKRYNSSTLEFWTSWSIDRYLSIILGFRYRTIRDFETQGYYEAKSLGLMLFFSPKMLYKTSRRPRTDMRMFRTVHSHRYEGQEDGFYPVTRYSKTLKEGLYTTEYEYDSHCGTFYYLEPESKTFLYAKSVLVATTKETALEALKVNFERLLVSAPSQKESMLLTPQEYLDQYGKSPRSHKKKPIPKDVQDREYYISHVTEDYGREDPYDQPLCEAAKAAGYELVILTHMIGARQVVSEILDTRDREVSYSNLYYS